MPPFTLLQAIPQLPCNDLDQTVQFYESIGFQLAHRYETLLIFKRDAIELHFWRSDDLSIAQNSSCYIRTTGIETIFKEIKKAGSQFGYELTKQPGE